jgi:hypothetical protein
LARRRAERRGCRDLSFAAATTQPGAGTFLAQQGWSAFGEMFRLELGGVADPAGAHGG